MPADLARAVLALEDGLVSRDQFVAACSALAFDPAGSFSTYFRSQGWATPESINNLEERLRTDRRINAPRAAATADYVSEGDAAGSTVDDHARSSTPIPSDQRSMREILTFASRGNAERYQLAGLHAAGGMGQVWLARDRLMRREVAFKDMRPERSGNARLASRFLREAFVTGQLEHPGIVPVYEVGSKAGDEPFYTMRFIRGRTLLQEIREFHAADAPDMTGLRFRELLTAFVAVCNAVAFAHSRGVLHRDLKPANIVLGDFGEVMVLDWGLAKTKSEVESDGGESFALGDSQASETEAGQVLGTPAYMSPEQAEGQIERQDERSDVYGLGAILYELLTGRPPFAGPNTPAILEQVRRVAPARPSQVRPGLPPALEAVCLKALSKAPAERYASAKAVADEARSWLADEPVSAWAEPFAVRARRWMRRHRTLVAAGIATSLAVVIAMAIGLIVVTGLNGRLDQANNALSKSNGDLESANRELTTTNVALDNSRKQSESRRIEAERARGQAERVTTYLVNAFRKPDPEVDGGKLTVAEMLSQTEKQLDLDRGIDAPTRCRLLTALGETYFGLGLLTEARRVLDKSVALTAAVGENDAGAISAAVNSAAAANAQNRTAETLAALQAALERSKIRLGPVHPTTLTAQYLLSNFLREAGRLDEARREAETALRLSREHLGEDDRVTLSSMTALGLADYMLGKLEPSIALFKDVIPLCKARLGPSHPDTLAALSNLAQAYQTARRLSEAADLMHEVLQHRKQRLGPDHSTTLSFMNNLAAIYHDAGRNKDALAIQTEICETIKTKMGVDHPTTLKAMNNLALMRREAGDGPGALQLLQEMLRLQTAKVGADHPETLMMMNNLAASFRDLGRYQEALALMEQALKLQTVKLGANHPTVIQMTNNLAVNYNDAGRYDDALPLMERAFEAQKARFGADNFFTLQMMANLAGVHLEAGKNERGLQIAEEAAKLSKAKLGPGNVITIQAAGTLAYAYRAVGKNDLALALSEDTYLAAKEKLGPTHVFTAMALNNLAVDRRINGRLKEATELSEAATKTFEKYLGPDNISTMSARVNLGTLRRQTGQHDAAIAIHEQVVKTGKARLGPTHPKTLLFMETLAASYRAAGQADRALPVLEEVLALRRKRNGDQAPDTATVLSSLGRCLLALERPIDAEKQFREALAIRAATAPSQWQLYMVKSQLGAALMRQKKFADAEPLLLAGYNGLNERKSTIPYGDDDELPVAIDRLVEFYKATGKSEKAEEWRKKKAGKDK